MKIVLAALVLALAIPGVAAKDIALQLEVVDYRNVPVDREATIRSERIRPGARKSAWILQSSPVRHWENIEVAFTTGPDTDSAPAMRFQLTYGQLRELGAPGSELQLVAVATGGHYNDPVVAEFRRTLDPEPTPSNPTHLMRAHAKALYLWKERHRHITRHGLPTYKNDVVLAYWVLRTARDLYESVGFVPSDDVQQVIGWATGLLDDPRNSGLFASDTAPAPVFHQIISQLGQRDRAILRQTVHAIEDDIGRSYLPEAQERGCAANTQMKAYLEALGPQQRRQADPDGTYFLRTVSNTALCAARALNRRPLDPGLAGEALPAAARDLVRQLEEMLSHADFETSDQTIRGYARSEAINLANAINDFERALADPPANRTEVSLLAEQM